MSLSAKQFLVFSLILLGENVSAKETPLTHSLYINEVMQSTIGGQFDRLNEYPDGWIELYNPGNEELSIKDYRIGKKNKFNKCYTLPDYKIPAKGYFTLFCDKEETVIMSSVYTDVVREVHTDFRITTEKESGLYLFSPDGTLADSVHLQKMPAPNIAFGRLSDGMDSLGYELSPTLGASNTGGHGKGILPDPTFITKTVALNTEEGSLSRFRLKVPRTAPTGAIIRYTTDGSEPCDTSKIYVNEFYVKKNTILKAALYADGYITPPAISNIVLFHGRNIKLPIISLNASEEDLFSTDHGIIKNNNSTESQYRYNWRRPAILNYFGVGGGNVKLSQRCEIRIGGAYSRGNNSDLKTFIIYADQRFGTPDYFKAYFWPNNRYSVSMSKSFALRNSGNDFINSHFRDGASQIIIGTNTDIDWQGFQPAIYYLNCEYQGILNIRERGNEDNIWSHYDKLEDITLIENGELKEGEYSQYKDFVGFYSDQNKTYEEYDSVMDLVEFTNLMIISTYMSNTDFPGNNNVLWRPIEEGGKWRWILKDVDRSFNIWGTLPFNYDYLNWILRVDPYNHNATANNESSTLLFRNLMQLDDYKKLFIDRFTIYLGDFMRGTEVSSVVEWCHDQMAPEWDYFSAAQSIKSKASWENEVNNMKSWSLSRSKYMYQHLKNFFSLGDPIPTTIGIGASDAQSFNISVNGIPLTKSVFDGNLYPDRVYKLDGSCKDSQYDIAGWEISTTVNGQTTIETIMSKTLDFTPQKNNTMISIKAIKGTNGVEIFSKDDLEVVSVTYNNGQGISSQEPFNGFNIVTYIFEDGSSYSEKKIINE